MPTRVLVRRIAAGLLTPLAIVASAAPAVAQTASASGFIPRAEFSFGFASLVAADPRFEWQADVGFEVDVVDYTAGRVYFRGEYEAVLGGERRPYDLNHGNYLFGTGATYRIGATEIGAELTHVSRHLSDRDNPPSISWNSAGVRVWHTLERGPTSLETEIGLARAMQQAYVDYRWTSDASITLRRRDGARRAWFVTGWGGVAGIDGDLSSRPRICGGRLEAGVRIEGAAAALELFGGYERRMDAYPTDRFRVRMWTVGFRLVR